jgi:hypothetical protein
LLCEEPNILGEMGAVEEEGDDDDGDDQRGIDIDFIAGAHIGRKRRPAISRWKIYGLFARLWLQRKSGQLIITEEGTNWDAYLLEVRKWDRKGVSGIRVEARLQLEAIASLNEEEGSESSVSS